MAGFPVLDVVIGLAFLYALFALTCTTVNELIAALMNRRATMLRHGIEHLLGDKGLADAIYQHPSIVSLGTPGKAAGPAPSYIPAERFAVALTDHMTGKQLLTSPDALAAGIQALPPTASRQLQVLFDLSKNDAAEFRRRNSAASFFERSKDRKSTR